MSINQKHQIDQRHQIDQNDQRHRIDKNYQRYQIEEDNRKEMEDLSDIGPEKGLERMMEGWEEWRNGGR